MTFAIPDHITHKTLPYTGPLRVMVDGVEVKDCTEAKVSEGWVEVISKDNKGDILLDGDGIAIKRIFGTVTIERI